MQGLRLSLATRLLLCCAGAVPVLLCRAPEAATGLRLLFGPGDTCVHHSRAGAAAGQQRAETAAQSWWHTPLVAMQAGAARWLPLHRRLLLHPGSTLLLCQCAAETAAGRVQCGTTDAGLRLPLAEALDLGHFVALPPLNTNRSHFEGKPRILVAVTSSSTSDVVCVPLQCPTPHLNTADSRPGLCHSSRLHCSAHASEGL